MKTLINKSWLTGMCDKVREVTGETGLISIGENGAGLCEAVAGIPAGTGAYAWKRMEYYAPIYSSGTYINLVGASMGAETIIYSDEPPIYDPSIQYMRFENGTEFVFDSSVGLSDASFLDNKYVGTLVNGELSPISGYYHIEYAESVVSDEPVVSGVGYDLRIYNYDYYSVLDTRFLDFVTSDNETAYPESGTGSDGYVYERVKSLISFTINSTAYQAEEGMTWAEWICSDNNTINVVLAGGEDVPESGVMAGGGMAILDANGHNPTGLDVIINGAAYTYNTGGY